MITTLLEKKGVHKNIDNDKLDFKEMIEKLILINIQMFDNTGIPTEDEHLQ
jgi:hypothetical protein